MTQRAETDRMRESDVPEIAAIERLSFTDPWSEQSIREELEAPRALCLVCRIDGRVAGYLGTRVVFDECDITNIAVHPDMRRQGVARLLLGELLKELRGVSRINLEVRESNAPARSFYEAAGFKECGRRRNYYETPVEDAILYTWFLEDEEC